MTKEKLIADLQDTTDRFLQTLSSIQKKELNIRPLKDSWTPAQVAEHLRLSDTEILKAVYGPAKETSRPSDEGIEGLKNAFLDFEARYKSPAVIIPADKAYTFEMLDAALRETRGWLKEAIAGLDLTETTPEVNLGELTRLEIFHFVIYHTERHIQQLYRITNSFRREMAS
ncbi:MAG TPA: DinB family protein [Chitinophagaceae bacterium]|nr:DinB family protein [Chitinophagaceae bacterium]